MPRRSLVASRIRKHTGRLIGEVPIPHSQHAHAEHLADRTSVTVLHREHSLSTRLSQATQPPTRIGLSRPSAGEQGSGDEQRAASTCHHRLQRISSGFWLKNETEACLPLTRA